MEEIPENNYTNKPQNQYSNYKQLVPKIQGPSHTRNANKMQPHPFKKKMTEKDLEFHQNIQKQPIMERNKLLQVRKTSPQKQRVKPLNLDMLSPKDSSFSYNNAVQPTNQTNIHEDQNSVSMISPRQSEIINSQRSLRPQFKKSSKFLSPNKKMQQTINQLNQQNISLPKFQQKKSSQQNRSNFQSKQLQSYQDEQSIFENSFADVMQRQKQKSELQQSKLSQSNINILVNGNKSIYKEDSQQNIPLTQKKNSKFVKRVSNLSYLGLSPGKSVRSSIFLQNNKLNSGNQTLRTGHHQQIKKHSGILDIQLDFVKLQNYANEYDQNSQFIGHTIDCTIDDLEKMRNQNLQKVSQQIKQTDQFTLKEQNRTMNVSIQNKLKVKQGKKAPENEDKIQIIKNMLTQYKVLQYILAQQDRSYEEIYMQLLTMKDCAHDCGDINSLYHLQFLLLNCIILRDAGDYKNVFLKFKELRIFCNIYKQYKFKLKIYLEIIEAYSQIKNLKKAQIYLGKLLKLSWKLNDRDFEIKAYDLIGVNYFYQGKSELANYFHWRSVNDQIEPQTAIRKVGESQVNIIQSHDMFLDINKLQKNELNTDSEEEFDLEPIQNSIKIGQNIDIEIRKFNIPIPRTLRQRNVPRIGRMDKAKVFVDEKCENKQFLSHRSANRSVQQYAVNEENNNFLSQKDDYMSLRCRYINFENNVPKYKKFITERCTALEKYLITLIQSQQFNNSSYYNIQQN